MKEIPKDRIELLNQQAPQSDNPYVLYWMNSCRRLMFNYGLDHAVARAAESGKGLVIVETLFCDEPWASERFHRFVLEGMLENAGEAGKKGAIYLAWAERSPDELFRGLEQLSRNSVCVVVDEFPMRFHSRKIALFADRVDVQVESVDSNGLLPMRAADRIFKSAYSFRRFLQGTLPDYLNEFPRENPLSEVSSLRQIELKPVAGQDSLEVREGQEAAIKGFSIDHSVGPADNMRGGPSEAIRFLERFLSKRLHDYAEFRNRPDLEVTSDLSPYLHFGHISPHQVFHALADAESWSPERFSARRDGQKRGWWGMSENAESFLDELVTWRELGFNMASQSSSYDDYESLPQWALKTLDEHASDTRPHLYSLRDFEAADTHDELWNAAQRQLLMEGKIHNYLRMLWGKKILEWTRNPQEALDVMIELNNKFALDGRDPNSYSGIFWVLGRYDRAWGPERAVFGKVRYMTSRNTARKYPVNNYLRKFSGR